MVFRGLYSLHMLDGLIYIYTFIFILHSHFLVLPKFCGLTCSNSVFVGFVSVLFLSSCFMYESARFLLIYITSVIALNSISFESYRYIDTGACCRVCRCDLVSVTEPITSE
ncbi:hypothetical protein V1506DRAFT_333718 [Lipomyces tetrasporus]